MAMENFLLGLYSGDLTELLCSFLPLPDLIRFSNTSKQIQNAIREREEWKRRSEYYQALRKQNEPEIERISKTKKYKHFTLKCVEDLKKLTHPSSYTQALMRLLYAYIENKLIQFDSLTFEQARSFFKNNVSQKILRAWLEASNLNLSVPEVLIICSAMRKHNICLEKSAGGAAMDVTIGW